MRMIIGISDWPENMEKEFDLFPVRDGETDEEAIQRAKDACYPELEVHIVERPDSPDFYDYIMKERNMLQEGDVIELKAGMKVYAMVPEHFVYGNHRGSFKLVHTDITLGGDFDYLEGKYVVTRTCMEGGGGRATDYYPDGHHVYCKKVDDQKVEVDFYQSGCFTAMIENIKPVGKAKLTWSL